MSETVLEGESGGAPSSRNSAEPRVQPGVIPKAYGVRRDMRFVFATEEVGYKRYLPHLQITLTTLAEEQRLALWRTFHRRRRVAAHRRRLAIQDDEHKLTRSSVGAKGLHGVWKSTPALGNQISGAPRHRRDVCHSNNICSMA